MTARSSFAALVALCVAGSACGPGAPPHAPAAEATAPAASTSSAPVASATASRAPASPAREAPTSAPSGEQPPTRPERTKSGERPTKISARHILIQWMGCDHAAASVLRTREQAWVVAEDVLRRAKRGDDFARLAVEFSDEPNAGQRGGSLGRFGHGQMVPAFEAAAFALEPGEISGIVETGFGFHVIQRTE